MNAEAVAIYSTLQGTTAITSLLAGTTSIYHLQAPEGATDPYIVFSLQGGGDTNDSPHRVKDHTWFIRAYATGSNGAATAGSIDDQIDTLLHLNPISITGWSNLWLARDTDLETVENDATGQQVHMQGGFYRFVVEKP